jgi:hypothetical protein
MELVQPPRCFPALTLTEAQSAALYMVEVFASIGAAHFDVTMTHIDETKRMFRPGQTVEQLCQSLPFLMKNAPARKNNIIIRPRVEAATCIQLDDLDAAKAARIAPAAFLTLQTSPGNFQSWVAVKAAPLGTTARLRRGIGADLNASGATRVAGTFNFKMAYAPHFPIVRVAAEQLGHVATMAELEALGVLAPELPRVQIETPTGDRRAASRWPNYQRCIEGAPIGPSGNPSRTAADFVFCKIALSWRHSIEATARELMRVSTKAQENGEGYALQTAERAMDAAAQYNAKKPKP